MALLVSLFLDCAHHTDLRDTVVIRNFNPLRLKGGGDLGCQVGVLDEKSVGNCSLENVKCTSMDEEIGANFNETSSFRSDLIFENTSSDTESVFSDLNSSLLEGDIRDILFEAGYTREAIENVIASKSEMNVDKSLDSAEISNLIHLSLSLILRMQLTC